MLRKFAEAACTTILQISADESGVNVLNFATLKRKAAGAGCRLEPRPMSQLPRWIS
jgi:hypothetical protein